MHNAMNEANARFFLKECAPGLNRLAHGGVVVEAVPGRIRSSEAPPLSSAISSRRRHTNPFDLSANKRSDDPVASKSANLRLEEPALTTAIGSDIAHDFRQATRFTPPST